MFEGSLIKFIGDNITKVDFLDEDFLSEFLLEIRKNEKTREANSIKLSDKKVPWFGDYYKGSITIYKSVILTSYNVNKDKLPIKNETLFLRNILFLLTLIHEVTHAYQEYLIRENNEVAKLFSLSNSIKDGDILKYNSFASSTYTLLSKLNLSRFALLYKSYTGSGLYVKHHNIFPIETHADGMSYKFILKLYEEFGKGSFSDFEGLGTFLSRKITKNYFLVNGKVISALDEFLNLIKFDQSKDMFGLESMNYIEKVLSGFENDADKIEEVNTKVLSMNW